MPLRLDVVQFDELVADPVAPIDGDVWFNTTANELRCRVNGTTAALVDANMFAKAIQSDVAAQISAITLKAVPIPADVLLIEDSAAGDAKKRITVGSLPGGAGGDTITVNGSPTTSTNVDLDDAIPAPPAGEVNVKWQKDALAPTNVSASVQASTEVQKGVLELATQAETDTGTDDTRAVTPLKLASTTIDGIDGTAVHDDIAGEIAGVAEKGTPVGADLLLIEDSAAANVKKRVQIANLPGGSGGDTITINGLATASTDVDFDDTTPGPPADGTNVLWQKDALSPTNVSASAPGATETQRGALELATQVETDTGTDDVRGVTPLKLATVPLAGRDTTAIHDDISGEIAGVTAKTPLVGADLFLIEDSAAANVKKSATMADIRITEAQVTDLTHTDPSAVHVDVAAEIAGVALKGTPVGADLLLIEDSAAANAKKRIAISTLPGSGGGDNISVNGAAASDANFNNTTPAASGSGTNVLWQKDAAAPDNISAYLQESTEGQRGAIELATQAETDAGADDTRAVTPLKLASTTVDGLDGTAIHDDTAGEIAAITPKTPLVAADVILIEDSAAANAKKSATVADLRIVESQITDLTHTDPNAVHVDVAAEILGVTEKVTPVAADVLLIEDSAAANVKKRVQIGNLPGGGGFLEQKAGRVLTVSFSGNPLTAAVVFSGAFPDTNYGIQLTALTDGTRSFTPNATTKAVGGFTIDLGTAQSTGLTEVAWLAVADGEST